MNRFVVVPYDFFDASLRAKGFEPVTGGLPRGTREVVYERHVEDTAYAIRVFSGYLADGWQRGRGEDAIRVLLTYVDDVGEEWPRYRPVKGMVRVHRTGTPANVVERTVQRARAAWVLGRSMLWCRNCTLPVWPDSKRHVFPTDPCMRRAS